MDASPMMLRRILVLCIVATSMIAALFMRPQITNEVYRIYYLKIKKMQASHAEKDAEALYDKKDYPGAIDLTEKFLIAFPGSTRLKRIRGLSLYMSGAHLEGAKYLFPLLSNSEEDVLLVQNIAATLFEERYFKDVITLLSNISPGKDAALNFYLGASLVETGNIRKALSHLEKSEARGSNNSDVYYYLGRAHEKLGDDKTAITQYRQALAINRFHREAKKALIALYTKKGNYQEAERIVRGRL